MGTNLHPIHLSVASGRPRLIFGLVNLAKFISHNVVPAHPVSKKLAHRWVAAGLISPPVALGSGSQGHGWESWRVMDDLQRVAAALAAQRLVERHSRHRITLAEVREEMLRQAAQESSL